MSLHNDLTDGFLLVVGTTTGVIAMEYEQIDLISGIILKWVSIVSFAVVAAVNLKKLLTPKKTKSE
jgi:hypothetical protein